MTIKTKIFQKLSALFTGRLGWIKYVWFMLVVILSCEQEVDDPILSFGGSGRVEIIEDSLPNIVSSYGPGVSLNKPAPSDITVYLTASGTAMPNEDYKFRNPVVINRGSTYASVDLQFIDDKLAEFDEEGIFRVERIEGGKVSIDTAAGRFLIRDNDAADLRISVLWGTGGNTGSDHIDMDLYLWRETVPGSNQFELVQKAAYHGVSSGVEGIQLSGLEKDGLYGISYVYYQGNTDNFTFRCIFESIGASILEGGKSRVEFNPTYDRKNLNTGAVNLREQFFTKKGFEFKNITEIVVPSSGS
jgi:hypothetical protein